VTSVNRTKQSCPWLFAALTCAALVLGPADARGQTSAAAADALFDKAVALMQQNKYDEACPALAESQKLDPRPGTLFTLADCESGGGKIASAVAHYKEYLRIYETLPSQVRKRHDERAKLAKTQVGQLEPQVPTLKLSYPGELPAGLQVTQDGVDFGLASLNTVLPVDPGEHVIVTKVPGRPDVEQRVKVERRAQIVVDLSKGSAAGPAGTGSPTGTGSAGTGQPPVGGQPVDQGPPSNTRRNIGLAIFGVGAAGLVLGGVMGGLALGGKGTVDQHCTGLACDATGFDALEQARLFGTVSTIGFAAGGALALTGGILFLTAPRAQAKTGVSANVRAAVGPGALFFTLQGDF
jgi:hypothetical protein